MAKYRMRASISGTRNGQDWPKPGQEVELPEQEAADYLRAGLIVPLKEAEPEKATAPTAETATKPRRRRGSAKNAVKAEATGQAASGDETPADGDDAKGPATPAQA